MTEREIMEEARERQRRLQRGADRLRLLELAASVVGPAAAVSHPSQAVGRVDLVVTAATALERFIKSGGEIAVDGGAAPAGVVLPPPPDTPFAAEYLRTYVVLSADGTAVCVAHRVNDLTIFGGCNAVSWVDESGPFSVYCRIGTDGPFGLVGRVDNPSFIDNNVEPDFSKLLSVSVLSKLEGEL